MHMPLGIHYCEAASQRSHRYDKDIVFLVVPDESAFGKRIPLVIGTCTLAQVINVIKESEMDNILTLWVTARLVQLLS